MSHPLARLLPLGLSAVALALAGAAPSQAATHRPAASSFESRLRAVEDYQAIQKLLADYMVAMDSGDWTGYAGVFAKDGELMFQSVDEKGRDAIRTRMSTPPPRPPGSPPPAPGGTAANLKHTLTNIDIRIDGDHATSEARWTVMSKGPMDRPNLGATGHYSDTLVRENGEWKIQKRIIYTDFPFDDPVANLAKKAATAK